MVKGKLMYVPRDFYEEFQQIKKRSNLTSNINTFKAINTKIKLADAVEKINNTLYLSNLFGKKKK